MKETKEYRQFLFDLDFERYRLYVFHMAISDRWHRMGEDAGMTVLEDGRRVIT